MHRLFVALRPPPTLRGALAATTSGVRGARWQSDEQLHVTLAFLGNVDTRIAEDVAASLGLARGGPIELAVEGVDGFSRKGAFTSLHALVRPTPALEALQASVATVVRRSGVIVERRGFRPHVTLARLPRGAASPSEWISEHVGLRLPSVQIDRFILFESFLGPDGADYVPRATYPLI